MCVCIYIYIYISFKYYFSIKESFNLLIIEWKKYFYLNQNDTSHCAIINYVTIGSFLINVVRLQWDAANIKIDFKRKEQAFTVHPY